MLLPRRALAVVSATVLALALTGCSSDGEGPAKEQTPQQALERAQVHLDDTSGLHLRLWTEQLPTGVSGLVSADGTASHDPAFDGTIEVIFGGMPVEVPVRAVDGKVYAQVPLTTGWSQVDPADYQAPDPAELISSEAGISSLLTATHGLERGSSVRGGTDNADILTTYTGTVDGQTMKGLLPSADGDSFDVEYQLSDADELRKAVLTGVFYPDSPAMTYTLTLDDYGTDVDITAPPLG